MTTIIIDGKTKAIYADSQVTQDITRISSSGLQTACFRNYLEGQKIHKINNKMYLVGCGDTDVINLTIANSKDFKSLNLFTPDKYTEDWEGTTLFSVILKGEVLQVTKYITKVEEHTKYFKKTKLCKWEATCSYILEDRRIYAGSGSEYAEGAYHVCQDPVKSIVAASKGDLYTNNIVQQLNLETSEEIWHNKEQYEE